MMNRWISRDAFSEESISKIVQEELGKRQFYRPIYSIHKWWARRAGAQFRSLILLATRRISPLFEKGRDGTISASSQYFMDHSLDDIIIFDPFMGGGTTLVEANRMGAKVVGCDINPVSFWIVRESLKPIDLEELQFWFKRLSNSAGTRISELYRTRCNICASNACATLYAFWIRHVRCPYCDEDVPLFKRALLNHGKKRTKPVSDHNPATVFCPKCYEVLEWTGTGSCKCSRCSNGFDPKEGTYNYGKFRCPSCDTDDISLVEMMKEGHHMEARLVAIEYWCPSCKDRLYKSPDSDDLKTIQTIEADCSARKKSLVIPDQSIIRGSTSKRWRNHNYTHYHDVFNSRQLIAYNYIIEGIRNAPNEVRNAFITILSNSLEYNNMMTPYNFPHRKLHHLFTYHALPLTTTPVENNVWGVLNKGAGTFINCYQRYVNAKKYCRQPFDKYKDARNKIQTIGSRKESIEAKFVTSFDELVATSRGALLLCKDSSGVPELPDKSVDYVITDPPYFDNIHYSELSNFFYVWLRKLIDHQFFKKEHVPMENEAVVNEGMKKGEDIYRNLMTSVFTECSRVLKDNGMLVFTFHHTKWRAWWAILEALRSSDFAVSATIPVKSEYKVSPHIRERQALDMDLVFFCERRRKERSTPPNADKILSDFRNEAIDSLMKPSRDWVHLNYIGTLLRMASVSNAPFTWFQQGLESFEGTLDSIVRELIDSQVDELDTNQLTLV